MVISTDRTGFHHRVSSAVAARLVLRQATVDDAAAFGLDPRRVPRQMVPGRGIWATTGEEVQVAVLDPDPAGAAQANAVNRLVAQLRARWDGHPGGPRRLDPLPDVITADEAERLRPQVKPQGVWCTPVVGGDHLAPVDVDLADGGFLIAGPARSGRSTALVAVAATLNQNLLVVAPRPSPLRDLPGVLGVVSPDELPDIVANAGPLVLIVDDAELVTDPVATDALEVFARSARDRGAVLVAAATTEDLLANSYRGWLATLRRTRTGLLLNPSSHVDGEVFGLRLPRSVRGGQPPGRGLLVVRGEAGPAQVIQPATAALR
jgi:S-DNA-T family DNA segregation ATPase FtsK/SpoIIIE